MQVLELANHKAKRRRTEQKTAEAKQEIKPRRYKNAEHGAEALNLNQDDLNRTQHNVTKYKIL